MTFEGVKPYIGIDKLNTVAEFDGLSILILEMGYVEWLPVVTSVFGQVTYSSEYPTGITFELNSDERKAAPMTCTRRDD
jgi:hypothetical protein